MALARTKTATTTDSHCQRFICVLIAALLPILVDVGAFAAGDAKLPTGKANAKATKSLAKPAAPPEMQKAGSLAEQYCKSIRDAAGEARHAYQTAELKAIGKDIDERIAALEARTAELKDWFSRREEFARMATDQLVNIYAGMRTEAASEQLSRMEEFAAAAILSRLDSRAASAILNDIQPDKAARLASILAGVSRKSSRGDKS